MTSEGGSRKNLIWGLALIAIGGAFLLERTGALTVSIGDLWPLIFVVIGTTQLFEGRPGSAITFFLLGAWFMACSFGWGGLTYRNSWPLAMVAAGSGMVVRSLSGEDDRRKKKEVQHG